MSNINDLTKDFEDVLEWRHFCEAQFKTITSLNKKISKLEEENTELKRLLQQTTPLLDADGKLSHFEQRAQELAEQGLTAAEIICHLEIHKLKQVALRQELTMEETRKLDILIKGLHTLKDGKKSELKEIEGYASGDLLKIIEGGSGKTS